MAENNKDSGSGILLVAAGVAATALASAAGNKVGEIESRMAEVTRRKAIEEYETKKELQLFKKYAKKEG